MAARAILCHTVETGDGGLEWPKDVPVVDFSDESQFTRLMGQAPDNPEHNWEDVLRHVLGYVPESTSNGRRRNTGSIKKARDDIRTMLDVLLRGYMRMAGTDQSCAVRDMLTELMHMCDSQGLDFSDRVRLARRAYREESAIRHPLGGGRRLLDCRS